MTQYHVQIEKNKSLLPIKPYKEKINGYVKIGVWLMYPLLITFLVEFVQQGSLQETLNWMYYRPWHVFLGYFTILLVFIGIGYLFNRTWVAVGLTSAFFLTAALVNYFKMIVRGDPFVPWDLMLSKELKGIMGHIEIKITPLAIGVVIVALLCTILAFWIKDEKKSIKSRATFVAISIGTLFLCFQFIYLNKPVLEAMRIYDANWSQNRNYEYNGFLMGFLINVKNIIISEPEEYNKEKIDNLIANTSDHPGNGEKPNIIMIMNESFWDPTKLENVVFSTNPMPNIQRLREEGMSGWILSQQYGGGTANTEFEVLTGDGMLFLPSGAMAYQQYVKEELPSLASYLKSQGYSTTAIHSYQKWFWNREDVYPLIGFDKFISDEDFKNPEIRGNFISDKDTVERVISEYEKAREEGDEPFFGFAVTMQNHSTYEAKVYDTRNISAYDPNVSDEANTLINNYVQGVKDADEALGELISYFEEIEEPTIVVMFGDHLPMLGNDYMVYKETGYIPEGDWEAEDYLDMYTTPFVAWNNYDLEQEDVGIINAHYLAPTVLSSMGVELPVYFDFLLDLKEEVPAYTQHVCIDEEGNPQLTPTEEMAEKKEEHWLLQYDLMFGEGYGKEALFKE